MELDSPRPKPSDADKRKALEAVLTRKALEESGGEFVEVTDELPKDTAVKKNEESNVNAEEIIRKLRRKGL